MDDNGRRRRQNEPPISATPNQRYPVHDPNAQRRSYGAGAGASDRYRPAPLNTSPSAARGMGGAAAYSGYYQEPATAFSQAIPQNTMPYQSEYGQDTRQQTQSFGGYNTSMMYNVPQAGAQSAVYDTSQQFPSRQPAGLQMMPADVAAPYFPNEPTSATAASGLQPQAGSSSSAAVYQQGSVQSYPGGMASMSGMAQTSAPEQSMEDQEYPGAEVTEAYAQYQSALKEIFTNIRNGALVTACESLLNVSDWLLSKVADLGLTGDDPRLHNDRINMWHDFNHAWLGLLTTQKDMVEARRALQRGQSLLSVEELKKMGKELVRLCDGIERHGLVDYEYGVWEEQIELGLEGCLDQYEQDDPGAANATGSG